jgi:hypothetical protein
LRQEHDLVAVVRSGGQFPSHKYAAAHLSVNAIFCFWDEWFPVVILNGLSRDFAKPSDTISFQRHNYVIALFNSLEV